MSKTVDREQDFARDVMPVYERWAGRCRLDDETRSVGLALCWYDWSHRKTDYAPSHWARLAVRKALCGRDLPIDSNSQRDVWAKRERFGGGGMEGLADRRRGPAETVADEEELAAWEGQLGAREKHILALVRDGAENREIARILGITPARVSQIKRQMAGTFYGWTD